MEVNKLKYLLVSQPLNDTKAFPTGSNIKYLLGEGHDAHNMVKTD